MFCTRAPREKLDHSSKDYCSGYDWFRTEFTYQQLSPTRTGLNRTGEEKSDQEGHNYVNKLQDRKGASGLELPQKSSIRFWEIPRPRRDLPAPKSPFFDHDSSPRMWYYKQSQWRRDNDHGDLAGRHELRSGWWPDGPGYENVTPKAFSTISPAACLLELDPDTEPEMLFPPETRPTFRGELVVEIRGIQAGSVTVEANTFGLNMRQHAIYQPTNDQYSGKEHPEKWSRIVRFCYNKGASKGVFTGRVDNQIETLFFLKKMSFQGPCGSTSSTEIRESNSLSHSVSEETVEPNELDHFGCDWIRRWKAGPGRNKDWRSSRYLKSLRKAEQGKYQLLPLGGRSSPRYLYRSKAASHHLAITHSPPHIAVPKNMLRQKSTSCQGHSSILKPKSAWQAKNEMGLNKKTIHIPKSPARCKPRMTDSINSLDIEEAQRLEGRFSAEPEVFK